MRINRKHSGCASSIPVSLLIGAIVALLSTLLLSAILAKLVDAEKLRFETMNYGVMAILILCSFLYTYICCGMIKRKVLFVSLLCFAVYFVILISITAMFFGGQYHGVGVTALLILCGSMLAAMVISRGGEKRKRRKSR